MEPVVSLFFTRYDVEIYQRLESLIEKTLPLHPTERDEVMALMERVLEAQRLAKTVPLALGFPNSSPLSFLPSLGNDSI